MVHTDTDILASLTRFDATLDLVGQDPQLPVLLTVKGGRATSLITMLPVELAAERGVQVSLQATQVTTGRVDRLTR